MKKSLSADNISELVHNDIRPVPCGHPDPRTAAPPLFPCKPRCAAIYARGRFAEQQVAACRVKACALAMPVAAVYCDPFGSAMNVVGRTAFQEMLEALRAGRITDVIVADLDRLSRNLATLLSFSRLLGDRSVALWTLEAERPVEPVQLVVGPPRRRRLLEPPPSQKSDAPCRNLYLRPCAKRVSGSESKRVET